MKRLLIYTNKNKKRLAFDGIITRKNELFFTKFCLIDSYKEIVLSILDKSFTMEFKDRNFTVNDIEDTFERFDTVEQETNLIHKNIQTVSPDYILDIIYPDGIEKPINVNKICNFFNVNIEQDNQLEYDGLAISDVNTYTIKYRKGQYGDVKDRFTIGHELGHIFLHFPSNKASFMDKGDDLRMVARGATSSSYKDFKLEMEAERFAAELLMPKNEIEIFLLGANRSVYMSELRRMFNVSNGAIYKALNTYGLLSKVIDDCRSW